MRNSTEGDFFIGKVDFSRLKSDGTDYDVYMIGENHDGFRDNAKIYGGAIDFFVNELNGDQVVFEHDQGVNVLVKHYNKPMYHPVWYEWTTVRKAISLTPIFFDVTFIRKKTDYYSHLNKQVEFHSIDLPTSFEATIYGLCMILEYNRVPFLGAERRKLFELVHKHTFKASYVKVVYHEREFIQSFVTHYKNNTALYDEHINEYRDEYDKLIKGIEYLYRHFYLDTRGTKHKERFNKREEFLFNNFKQLYEQAPEAKYLLFNGYFHLAHIPDNWVGLDCALGNLIEERLGLKVCRIAVFYFKEAKQERQSPFIVPKALWKFFKKRIKSKYYLYKMGSWETPVPHENPYDYILFVK